MFTAQLRGPFIHSQRFSYSTKQQSYKDQADDDCKKYTSEYSTRAAAYTRNFELTNEHIQDSSDNNSDDADDSHDFSDSVNTNNSNFDPATDPKKKSSLRMKILAALILQVVPIIAGCLWLIKYSNNRVNQEIKYQRILNINQIEEKKQKELKGIKERLKIEEYQLLFNEIKQVEINLLYPMILSVQCLMMRII